MNEHFNRSVKKVLAESSHPSDDLLIEYMERQKHGSKDYYSFFDNIIYEIDHGSFNIIRPINNKKGKYRALIETTNGIAKEMYFSRYDSAEKWLGKEVLYFLRDQLSRNPDLI